jgi:hypothetical protein
VFEIFEAIEIKQGEAGLVDRSKIATAALYVNDPYRLACERIRQFDL